MIRIALDGPSGAGKSSLAKEIAKKLGIVYLDTGALYRTVGLFAKRNGVSLGGADFACEVGALLGKIKINVKIENGSQKVFLCGADVGDSIRTPEISMYASAVSAIPAVRAFLLETQRSIARSNSVIMDGRDIGTVILPDADVKIYLTASDEVRAERRRKELAEKGIVTTFDEVLADMKKRDRNDSTRTASPAVAAADAVVLDNSALDFNGTLDAALAIIAAKTCVGSASEV